MNGDTFSCPQCGGKTWGALDPFGTDVVCCNNYASGHPLSVTSAQGAKRGGPCGWRGRRSECGLGGPGGAVVKSE